MPDDPDTVPPWRNAGKIRRWGWWIGGASLFLILTVSVFYPYLKQWRRDRILRTAKAFYASQDYRSAYLLLDQIVKEVPHNFEARRLLAQLHEFGDPGYALAEWEQLTVAEPTNPQNFVGYARHALRLGQVAKMPAMLDSLRKLQPEDAEYHRLAAALALARSDLLALRREVQALAKLEPDNRTTQLTLALLLMKSRSADDVAVARSRLEEYSRQAGPPRVRATLALIADAPRRWPEEGHVGRQHTKLARQLGVGVARMSEARRFLVTGAGSTETGLQDLIEHMQAQKELSPADAAQLAQWMRQSGRTRDALLWMETLEPALWQSPAVLDAMAACSIDLLAWAKLEQLLAAGAWGPMPPEVVKLAFEARQLSAAGNDSRSSSAWSNALRLAETDLVALRGLQRLAQIWRWPQRQSQALWLLVGRAPGEAWAWNTLVQIALVVDDSNLLWRVYQAWGQAAPASFQVQTERAILGLLIRPEEPDLVPKAAELFQQQPGTPAARVAQALALWRTKRTKEAQAVLVDEPIDFSAEPRFALVRGLVLASLGRGAEAEDMFTVAATTRLLPEERALIAEARRPSR